MKNVVKGYNGTIMAYGQTGTGKTYTIVQDILPQCIHFLTKYIQKTESSLYFSAVQIYNEQLSDLLNPASAVKMREKAGKFLLENAHEQKIFNLNDLAELVKLTESNRNVGSTSMNNLSSRSHGIYMFKLVQRDRNMVSVLNLVDLAGSERLKKSDINVDKYDETIAINSSLTALSKCIIALSDKKTTHVPYRESKLTKLLINSLGGNSKTALVVTLSPNYNDIDETIASLSFGQRACKVACKPLVNGTTGGKVNIDLLKDQIRVLEDRVKELEDKNNELVNQLNGTLNRKPGDEWNSGNREK